MGIQASRSKVHAKSGAMKWDIRNAGKRFSDRFILAAGHCNPVVYATLAVFNEAESNILRIKNEAKKFQLTWEDLLNLRVDCRDILKCRGKLFFSKLIPHLRATDLLLLPGLLALKFSKAKNVKVFCMEGEGGITAGATHETINSAWGLGLNNLIYHLDWNDYGIDSRPFSSVLYGTPENWFGGHGWQVVGVENGECWEEITKAYYNILVENPDPSKPKIVYCKTRKGRGYLKYDFHSHGSPHENEFKFIFWETKEICKKAWR